MADWFTNLFHSSRAADAHATINDENRQSPQHKAQWSHELIAGAAGFEAMKSWEKHHPNQQGQVSSSKVQEVLAGLAAAAVDRLVETHGLDWIDAQRVKADAAGVAQNVAQEKYGGQDNQ